MAAEGILSECPLFLEAVITGPGPWNRQAPIRDSGPSHKIEMIFSISSASDAGSISHRGAIGRRNLIVNIIGEGEGYGGAANDGTRPGGSVMDFIKEGLFLPNDPLFSGRVDTFGLRCEPKKMPTPEEEKALLKLFQAPPPVASDQEKR